MEGKKQGSEALKKTIPQLLISVSLLCFLLSYSSLYISASPSPDFQHYFSFHLLNKNSLFLICNGLLVFLAKTSGFIQPPTAHDLDDVPRKGPPNTLKALHKYVLEESDGGKTAAADGGPKEVSIFIAESEEEEEEGEAADPNSPHVDEDHETPTTCWLFDDDGEHLYGQEGDGGEDEDGDKEEEEETVKTEELNRKFEDFIRKMKEEIIINEAGQKVAMLN